MSPHVAINEAQQEVRVRVIRIKRNGPLHRMECIFVATLIVEDLAKREVRHRTFGIELQRFLYPVQRLTEVSARFFGKA